jgi:phosphatidate cytidylyltransferase
MLDNPFSDPLFATVASRVAGALLVLLAGALFREWRRRHRPEERSLLVPVATAAAVTSLFLLAIFAGGIVLVGFATLVGLLGLSEYARITMLDRSYSGLVAAWSIAGLLVATFSSAYLMLLLPIGLFLAATLIPIVSGRVDGAHRQVSGAMFGYVYIGLPMAYLVFIRSTEAWGLRFLLVVCAAAWLADMCGYTVGSKVKGPKLAPTVSPAKTWSGAVGSVIGAVLGVALMQTTIPVSWSLVELVPLTVVTAISAIWGDLIESFVKRDFKVKDAGAILPGFGGVLDRFDSLLITIPIAYHVILGARFLAR